MSVPQNQPAVVLYKLSGHGVLLLGVAGLIAAIAMLLFVVAIAGEPLVEVEAAPPTKHGFQLVQLGDFRRDQFLLDTDSGRIWESVCAGNVKDGDCDGVMVWSEMCVDGVVPKSKQAIGKCFTRDMD